MRAPLACLCGGLLLIALLSPVTRREILFQPWTLTITPHESRDGVAHLKKFWGEQQAAINLIRNYPLWGVGAGQYQQHINQAYDQLGPITDQRMEADMQNGYLLTAASTGIAGLIALIALLSHALAWPGSTISTTVRTPGRSAACARCWC